MTTTRKKEEKLCREWEQFAATLSVLLRGQDASRPAHSKIDRAIAESILSTEQEMMRISSEIAKCINVDDLKNAGSLPVAC